MTQPNSATDEALSERLRALFLQHGGCRQAARVLKIDHAYLYRLRHGQAKNPSKAVLRKLGLKQIITYKLVNP